MRTLSIEVLRAMFQKNILFAIVFLFLLISTIIMCFNLCSTKTYEPSIVLQWSSDSSWVSGW